MQEKRRCKCPEKEMTYLNVHAQMGEEQVHLRNVGACRKKAWNNRTWMIEGLVFLFLINRSITC